MREKALYYLSKGARMVWLVYAAALQVEICTLDEENRLIIQTIAPGGKLTASSVLPGFELALDELFNGW
jgi:Uma2 family endonuclease